MKPFSEDYSHVDDLAKSCTNLASFCPVITEITTVKSEFTKKNNVTSESMPMIAATAGKFK